MQFHFLDFHRTRGRKRAGPVYGDGKGVGAAFQGLDGDVELDPRELLCIDVPYDTAGGHGFRLRQRGEDAGILPLRVNEWRFKGAVVQLRDHFIAFDVIEQNEAQFVAVPAFTGSQTGRVSVDGAPS
jgi:hypothetical protein